MGTKYSTNSASGYNSSPPPDDGSTGSDNLVTWEKHKKKLADPVKTLAEAINTDLVAWADVSPTAKAINYTTLTSDHLRVIETTSSITVTLGATSSMGAGYEVTVKAVSGTTTVSTGQTIDGSASDRTLAAGEAETYVVNNSGSGYMLKQNKGITTTELSGLLLDEDDMASDSDTQAPTQQSVKVYVDSSVATGIASVITHESVVSLTSGSEVTLATDIPAGTSMIHVAFVDVITSASATLLLGMGYGATPTWESSFATANSATAYGTNTCAAASFGTTANGLVIGQWAQDTSYGNATVQLVGSNTWVSTAIVYRKSGGVVFPTYYMSEGALSGALTALRIATGSGTFTAGTARVTYY